MSYLALNVALWSWKLYFLLMVSRGHFLQLRLSVHVVFRHHCCHLATTTQKTDIYRLMYDDSIGFSKYVQPDLLKPIKLYYSIDTLASV